MRASEKNYEPTVEQEESDMSVEKLAGGFFRGVLQATGLALMAVIAGYSAGVAQEHYRASRARSAGAHH